MTNFAALADSTDILSMDAEFATLSFIADADYEYVGGGTAVNGL